MTMTVRELVKRSLRKLHVLASGREPTAAQAQDAVDVLQSMYRELTAQGVFGRLNDVLVTEAAYAARENERVVCNCTGGAVTVTLPETITQDLIGFLPYYDYWASDYGRGAGVYDVLPRPPRDGAIIAITDIKGPTDRIYIYEASKARWVYIDELTLDSIAPLTSRNSDGIAAMLAVRMAAEYGDNPPATVVAQANSARHALSMKADRGYRPVVAEYI